MKQSLWLRSSRFQLTLLCLAALVCDGGCRQIAAYSVADAQTAPDGGRDGQGDGPDDALAEVRVDAPEQRDKGPDDAPVPQVDTRAVFHDSGQPGACEVVLGRLYPPPPANCSDRWVWQSPADTGGKTKWPLPRNTLRAVWVASQDDAWAVGEAGTVLRKTSSGWQVEYVGGNVDLHAVWGTPSSVWIGGTEGTLIEITPTTRRAAILPDASATVKALWGRGPSDIWAATDKGPYHFDGTRWAVSNPPPPAAMTSLIAVAGLPFGGVAFVDHDGRLWHLDGKSWGGPELAGYLALASTSTTTVAAGKGGVLAEYAGGSFTVWQPITVPSSVEDLVGLTGWDAVGKSNYLLAGPKGKLLTLSGNPGAWALGTSYGVPGYTGRFWGSSSWLQVGDPQRHAMAVGEGGWIERPTPSSTGQAGPEVAQPGALSLRRLAVVGSGATFGISDGVSDGAIHNLDGPLAPKPPPVPPRALWASSANVLWTGDVFGLRVFDGTNWTTPPVTPSVSPVLDLWGVAQPNGPEVWALTSGTPQKVQYKAAGTDAFVTLSSTPTQQTLNRIWGYAGTAGSPTTTVVAGGGQAWRRTGTVGTWTELKGGVLPPSDTVLSLWAAPGVVYMVVKGAGPGGSLHIHTTATAGWKVTPFKSTLPLHAVWGRDANNVWAVGEGGVIRFFNGSVWSTPLSPTHQPLYDVQGDPSSNEVFAVGDWGTIIRLQ